jgi:hypothetical protein
MKHAVELGSGAMIYTSILNFIMVGLAIQKLLGGYSKTHRAHGDLISLLIFFSK